MKSRRLFFIIIIILIIALAAVIIYGMAVASGRPTITSVTVESKLSVTFFDIGQGDSALIVTPHNYQILVDGGPDNKIAAKLGQALPFYDHDLDLVILTHPHADHVAGLVEILNRYTVKKIILTGVLHTAPDYLDFLRLIKEKNIPVQVIDRPQDVAPEAGIGLSFLWPRESLAEKKVDNLNNSSIAFKLIYASTSFLFTGDLEEEEMLISSTPPETIKSDVLKVGHHGSNNANSESFLKSVSPRYAVIPVGADNGYGHPHYRTVFNLEKSGALILRTDQAGDIGCQSDGRSVSCSGNSR